MNAHAPSEGRRTPWTSCLPWLLLVTIVTVDVLLPIWVIIAPALAAVPALAAAVGRRARQPLQAGVLTLAASFVDALRNHDVFADTHLATLIAVTLTSAIGWATVRGRARRDRELAEVRATADIAQKVLLHPVPARLGPARIAVDYTAAAAHARIGGDLYDVALTRWGLRVLIGDVRGKGLPAVTTAATVLGSFREAAHDEPAPAAVVARIARSLGRELPPESEEFVTLALLCLPPARDGAEGVHAEVVNCGHPAPLLLRPGRSPVPLAPPVAVPPLAVLPPGGPPVPALRHWIARGEAVLLYTDGITEARDGAGGFYPLARRLPALETPDPDDFLRRLHEDVAAHVGHALDDDAAALLVRYDG